MTTNRPPLKCHKCGKERKASYTTARTPYCSQCINSAKSCGYCRGPMAAYNRSGLCSKCRHAGKGSA